MKKKPLLNSPRTRTPQLRETMDELSIARLVSPMFAPFLAKACQTKHSVVATVAALTPKKQTCSDSNPRTKRRTLPITQPMKTAARVLSKRRPTMTWLKQPVATFVLLASLEFAETAKIRTHQATSHALTVAMPTRKRRTRRIIQQTRA